MMLYCASLNFPTFAWTTLHFLDVSERICLLQQSRILGAASITGFVGLRAVGAFQSFRSAVTFYMASSGTLLARWLPGWASSHFVVVEFLPIRSYVLVYAAFPSTSRYLRCMSSSASCLLPRKRTMEQWGLSVFGRPTKRIFLMDTPFSAPSFAHASSRRFIRESSQMLPLLTLSTLTGYHCSPCIRAPRSGTGAIRHASSPW